RLRQDLSCVSFVCSRDGRLKSAGVTPHREILPYHQSESRLQPPPHRKALGRGIVPATGVDLVVLHNRRHR
ncbi:hypothetical protein PFISCL1PPCAC_25670, partial [Pristionchus fissidentatus]